MNHIEDGYAAFLDKNQDNLMTCEYLIPTVVSDLIHEGVLTVYVLSTSSVWYGITYKEDKDAVVASIAKMMDNGEYPVGVWKK